MKRYEIRYYTSDINYRLGLPAHRETIVGDRNTAIFTAEHKMGSIYKFYDLKELN